MEGEGALFVPGDRLTWTQAATIAARLHAAYSGAALDTKTDGAWYVPYMAYAAEKDLLPAGCPTGETANTTEITRQEIAGLFCRVLAAADLPAINDQSVPDLPAVSASYTDAVKAMYAAGVFTGKEGNRFDPDGLATRAEIATIVTRLLCPAQRVAHDSRKCAAMDGQESNLANGNGAAVTLGDRTYFLYNEQLGPDERAYYIFARDSAGRVTECCRSTEVVESLWAGDDGYLYFLAAGKKLERSLPGSRTAETLYTSPGRIHVYCMYGGDFYLYEEYGAMDIVHSTFRIVRVTNGTARTLADGMQFSQSVPNQLYCFNGSVYYALRAADSDENSLYAVPTDGGTPRRVLSPRFLDEVTFAGDTAYYICMQGEKAEQKIYRTLLDLPDQTECFASAPPESSELYMHLYSYRGDIYLQSSNGRGIWKAAKDGSVTQPYRLTTPYIEFAAFCPDGVIELGVDSMKNELCDTIHFHRTDGTSLLYADYLGRPHRQDDVSALPAAGGVFTAAAETEAGALKVSVTKAWFTAAGDLVLELSCVNSSAAAATLYRINFSLQLGSVQQKISIRDFSDGTIAAGSTAVRRYVFPAAYTGGGDLGSLRWTVSGDCR